MTEGRGRKTKLWIRAMYWVGLGLIVGQGLVTAFAFDRLPDVIYLGSFSGQAKLGPKTTIWVFPALAAAMVALPRILSRLPSSGLESAAGPKATAANEAVAELAAVALFIFAAICVGALGLVCILQNLKVSAHAALERLITMLLTVVPPILALTLVLCIRRNKGME